jgi:Ni,Fe-hydrogenase III component G
MPWPSDEIEGNEIAEHRPWPRFAVNEDAWRFAIAQLATGRWTLLGLWGDTGAVHMAVLDANMREIAVLTLSCPAGHYPALGALHPPAIRLERALRDLYGLEPIDLPDTRPWLDLGFWNVRYPLGERRGRSSTRAPYVFLPVAGDSLH